MSVLLLCAKMYVGCIEDECNDQVVVHGSEQTIPASWTIIYTFISIIVTSGIDWNIHMKYIYN